MKNQALFSSKDKSKKLKCRLLQFLFGALRVKFADENFVVCFLVNLKQITKETCTTSFCRTEIYLRYLK